MSRFSNHIRHNVVGYVALFFALTMGTAYATHPGGVNTISTDDIQNQAVTNQKIALQAVQTGRLADQAVTTAKLADGAVTNRKIAPQGVQTGRLANQAVTNAKLAPDSVDSATVLDDSLTGADVDESTLDLSSLFAAGESGLGACNADSAPEICASTTVNLPKASRVLVAATGNWFVFDFGSGTGDNQTADSAHGWCVVTIDGADQVNSLARVGERQTAAGAVSWTTDSPVEGRTGTLALTDITPVLSAGPHTLGVRCTDYDRDVDFRNVKVTAASLAG
jgi:hypothetical protein